MIFIRAAASINSPFVETEDYFTKRSTPYSQGFIAGLINRKMQEKCFTRYCKIFDSCFAQYLIVAPKIDDCTFLPKHHLGSQPKQAQQLGFSVEPFFFLSIINKLVMKTDQNTQDKGKSLE